MNLNCDRMFEFFSWNSSSSYRGQRTTWNSCDSKNKKYYFPYVSAEKIKFDFLFFFLLAAIIMHNASCNHHHHLKENFLYQLSNWDLHRSFFFDLLFALGLYFFVCVYCCGCCITFYCFLFFGIWLASLDFIVNIFNGPTIFFCQINNKVDDDDEDYNFFFSFDFFFGHVNITEIAHTLMMTKKLLGSLV